MRYPKKRSRGFNIVEALLAGAFFALVVGAITAAIIYGQESAAIAGARARAVIVAEEGLEAARNLRDASYSNLTDGPHGLAISGNQWAFSGSNDNVDIFNREVRVESVDAKRKRVTATVTWQQNPSRSGSVALVTYLTNWLASVAASWATPIKQSSLDLAGTNDALKIQVQGSYAYIVRADGTPDFVVINISDPAAPTVAGTLNLTGSPTNIAVSGNYAYVSNTDNGQELQIINISNPTSPTVAGTYNASGNANANGIDVSGTTVYLVRASSTDNEFLIINASNPASPTLTGSLDLSATGYEVTKSGNYAYIASGSNSQELQVVNINNPATPSLAGSQNLSGNTDAISLAKLNDIVYIGQGQSFSSISVATPATSTLLSSVNVGVTVNDISLGGSNNYAFLATASNSKAFQVIDISTLNSLTVLSSFDLAGNTNGVAYDTASDRAYLACATDTEELAIMAPQ